MLQCTRSWKLKNNNFLFCVHTTFLFFILFAFHSPFSVSLSSLPIHLFFLPPESLLLLLFSFSLDPNNFLQCKTKTKKNNFDLGSQKKIKNLHKNKSKLSKLSFFFFFNCIYCNLNDRFVGFLRKNTINSFSWSRLFLFWVFGWGRWRKSLGFWCGYGLCYVGFVWEGLWQRRTTWKWLHQALWAVSMNVHCACVSALIFLLSFFFFLFFFTGFDGHGGVVVV